MRFFVGISIVITSLFWGQVLSWGLTPSPTPAPDSVQGILEHARELMRFADIDGNCISTDDVHFSPVDGCLECGLADVGSPTGCGSAYIMEVSRDERIVTWRIGECRFLARQSVYIISNEYGPARSLAVVVHQAGMELGYIPSCEFDPFDEAMEYIARDPGFDRVDLHRIWGSVGCCEFGSGSLRCDQEDIGPSMECPNPQVCEVNDGRPVNRTVTGGLDRVISEEVRTTM